MRAWAVLSTLLLLILPVSAGAMTPIQTVTSPGGITAWLVRDTSIPVIALSFSFRGGSAADPAGREGVANMLSALLDEGAGELDSLAFQTRLQTLAVYLSFDAGRDDFYGSLRTLSRNREEAFDLLRLALNEPRFDPAPVERMRAQLQTSLRRSTRDPGTIASRAWFARAFGDHPYAQPGIGSEESLAAIGSDDLRAYAANRFVRDGLVVGVVGDISAEELAGRLDQVFGALPATAPAAEVPDVEPRIDNVVDVVDMDVPQSRIVFGGPGILRSDPDWYTAYVLNYILGGGSLTSRLGLEVRERRGLAYGVSTYLYPLDHAGLHMGSVGTQNSRVAETLSVVRAEIARLREEGVTAKELADAKTYLNGSFPLSLTSSAAIARILATMQREELGQDYLERRPELIDAVTADDVKRVAQRLLDPKKLFVVVVGRPGALPSDG